MKETEVTVCCTVFNHEKYLKKCLDGFVMQKTNFKFEVLIHDDASTDTSSAIIREYEKKYPDIIKPIYQTQNQYSQGIYIYKDILAPLIQGKYVAFCEGDDYWFDENKLQMQYDIMETHQDCHVCVHKVKRINESGEKVLGYHPSFALNEGILPSAVYYEQVINYYPFQTSSYFFRADDYRKKFQNLPEFLEKVKVGDIPTLLYFGTLGNIYYIDRIMSCYRYQSQGSWTSKHMENKKRAEEHLCNMVRMYESFDLYSDRKYTELIASKIHRLHLEQRFIKGGTDNLRYILRNADKMYWNEHSKHFRLYIFICAYCPQILTLYHKIKKHNQYNSLSG